ncbi:hypothetical protein HNQ34_003166 [Anoxybacillus tepidamans]|uniref:Uncharacterized protein n=1 Tax=Anoxybacteroides tepidamans TaxID=265948 RepID=A0A7W8ISU5_9BACL|nr:hypothetical protein [Anoxybacillus tepidamans]MBB5326048.1 hypothetical protein [Anoxybacillus tepidamans]
MKGIKNEQFWNLWRQKNYEEALSCSVVPTVASKEQRVRNLLFGGKKQIQETVAISTISVGEFFYDFIMLDHMAVEGIDFAREEDLSHLFSLSEFAKTVDTTSLTGDMAQLQGYVAERMIGSELQARGHDVEFPATSNQAGYDLLVDGEPFQVKNLINPQGVREHLERYPNIPVYVNEELGKYFGGNPQVYVTSVSHEEVINATKQTLSHAADLTDFEIPYITFIIYTASNVKRVWRNDLTIEQAVINILVDSTAKIAFAGLGKMIGTTLGVALFGPQYGILSAGIGAILFGSQSRYASNFIKKALSRKEEKELKDSVFYLSEPILKKVDEKIEIRHHKLCRLKEVLGKSCANEILFQNLATMQHEDIQYITYKRKELEKILRDIQTGRIYILDGYKEIIKTIPKIGVHPRNYQSELEFTNDRFIKLREKML